MAKRKMIEKELLVLGESIGIVLPEALCEIFVLQNLPFNPCYFNFLGIVDFTQLTVEQAEILIREKSSYLIRKEKAE